MLAEYSYTNNEAPEEKEFAEFTETGDTDSLKQYLREIGRYDLLSEEETKTLFKRIESGDKAAHDVVQAGFQFAQEVFTGLAFSFGGGIKQIAERNFGHAGL